MLQPRDSPSMRRPTPARLPAPLGQTRKCYAFITPRRALCRTRSLHNYWRLLRIQFDDQLLLDGHGDVVAGRGRLDRAFEAALVQIQPAGDAAAVHRLERLVDAHDLAALLLDRHHVADLHLEGGDVHLALVDAE